MSSGRILIVDDDPIVRTAVSSVLRSAAFETEEAATAEEALAHCKQRQFDLAILDYEMPTMTGLALAQMIRTVYEIPFIFLTVHDDFEIARRALSEGAQSYLVKPVEATELVAQVEVVLKRCAETRNLNRAVTETQLVNVAIGILMASHALTREEAFKRLNEICRPRQMKAGKAARRIVDACESRVRATREFSSAIATDLGESPEGGGSK